MDKLFGNNSRYRSVKYTHIITQKEIQDCCFKLQETKNSHKQLRVILKIFWILKILNSSKTISWNTRLTQLLTTSFSMPKPGFCPLLCLQLICYCSINHFCLFYVKILTVIFQQCSRSSRLSSSLTTLMFLAQLIQLVALTHQ